MDIQTYSLKVVQIRKETADTVTLCFKQPGLKKIKYLAGQYLTLVFRINGRRYIRPYSFSSAPRVDTLLEVTVKRVENGVVSNHIYDIVQENDIIEVMPPMGDFVYKSDPEVKTVYLWGIGSGITPLISLAKHILSYESAQVKLIYGNRNREATIFFDQIHQLQEKHGEMFNVKHFHTQLTVEENLPNTVQGRINQDIARSILEDDADLANSAHYICGPTGLKESVKNSLRLKNIVEERIFAEDFEMVHDPNDFKDILTHKVMLSYNQQKYHVEVVKGQSILSSALNANIELPYSCQTGSCSTCKGQLVNGDARMIGLSKERDDLLKNEYLLCCSYPLTSNVEIKI